MIRKLSGMRAALVPLLCGLLWSAAAEAQYTPPPIRPSVDENGVDLASGRVQYARTDIAIGQPGAGGLTYGMTYADDYIGLGRGQYTGTIKTDSDGYGVHYTVSIDNSSESFLKPIGASTIDSSEGSGSTLVENATTYTYTSSQGMVAVFSKSIDTTNPWGWILPANITSLTMPSGEALTYNYVSATYCVNTGCTITRAYQRLQSVTNNRGYQIKIQYSSNASTIYFDHAPYPIDWYRIIGAVGINMAVEYCDPFASSCSLTGTWPSVSYSMSGFSHIATDAITRPASVTYTPPGTSANLKIRWPGSTVDNVTYVFNGGTSVQSVNRNGKVWSYYYSATSTDWTTTVTDPLLRTSTYVFDVATRAIKSYTNTANEVTSYLNDSKGRPSTISLPSGQSIHYEYDTRGNIKETHIQAPGAADLVSSATFDATCALPKKCNKPNSTTDAAGNTTDYTYNSSHGGVLSVTRPAVTVNGTSIRPVTNYVYTSLNAYYKNAGGGLVSASPVFYLTQVWECRTTAACTATSADALTTDIGYGNAGVANNRLPKSTTVRDGAGTLIATTTTEYDDVGNVTAVDGPLAGTTDRSVMRYDVLRRPTWSVGPDQGLASGPAYIGVHTIYDPLGRAETVETGNLSAQTSSSWASGSTVQSVVREFDADGRVTKQSTLGNGSTFAVQQLSYDAAGRVDCAVTRMNPAAFGSTPEACLPGGASPIYGPDRITKYKYYDNSDRVRWVVSGHAVDPITEQTLTYYPGGRLETLADGNGNKTKYEYDVYGRLYRTYYPDPAGGGTWSASDYEQFTYDLNSQVISSRTRSNATISTPRDALGRITSRQVVGGDVAVEAIGFGYDLQGRLLSALNASSQGITQTYDGLGRVATRTAYGKTLGYQYFLNGQRKRLTYPEAGYYVEYAYTPAGQLSTITDWVGTVLATYKYDGLGARTELKRGSNSATTTYVPDALERLQQLNQAATGLSLLSSFQYNPAGQITKKTVNNDAAFTWTPPVPNSTVTTVPDGQNQLATLNGLPVGDDADGNIKTGINNLTYKYDALGRLREATGGASTVTVDYDPFGMLRSVTTGGNVKTYVYDGADLILHYQNGTPLGAFLHGPGADEPLISFDSVGAPTWLHADERGSIIAGTNSSGALTSSVKYSTDGEASGALVSMFGYTGQLYLPELQLYYYKARMYSPKVGRFLQPDPSRYAGGMNLYSYVSGDPINMIDPSGLEECRELSTIGSAAMPCVMVTAPGCRYCSTLSYDEYMYQYFSSLNGGGSPAGSDQPGGGGEPQGVKLLEKRDQSSRCDKPTFSTVLPDFFDLTINAGGLIGISAHVSVDRYGQAYWGWGPTVGKSLTSLSGSVTYNYMLQAHTATPTEMNNFMTGHAWNVTAGFWAGASYTTSATSDARALGAGLVTPQAGASWTYSWELFNSRCKDE